MTALEIACGKLHAVRTLWRMGYYLHNWTEVWRAYRSGLPMPPLQFRHGFTLCGGRWDSPVLMLEEVFGDRIYRRQLTSNPDGVIVDIGANIGAMTVDFASQWPQIKIHAYEPNPSTFEVLKRNVFDNRLAGRVELFNEAVAGHVGSFKLWTEMLSVGASGYYTESPSAEAKPTTVPCVDLATVFRRVGGEPIFLLKIDTEGAEVDILKRSAGLPFWQVQHIAVECHNDLAPGALEVCRRITDNHGFRCAVKPVAAHAGIYMLYGRRPADRQYPALRSVIPHE